MQGKYEFSLLKEHLKKLKSGRMHRNPKPTKSRACVQCSEQLWAETLTFSWINLTPSPSPAVLKPLRISRLTQQSGLGSKCGQTNECQAVLSDVNHWGLYTWIDIKYCSVYHQSSLTHCFKSGTAAHKLSSHFSPSSRKVALVRKWMFHQDLCINVIWVKLAQGPGELCKDVMENIWFSDGEPGVVVMFPIYSFSPYLIWFTYLIGLQNHKTVILKKG